MKRTSKYLSLFIISFLFTALISIFILPSVVFADPQWEYKYNYMENEWEYVPGDSSLKYNYMENEWEYVPDDYSLKYNYMENDYSYAPSNSTLKYNYMENEWEYAPDDYSLKYNYMDNKWEYAPRNSTLKYNYMKDNWKYVPDYTNNDISSSSSSYTNNDSSSSKVINVNDDVIRAEYNFIMNVYNLLDEYNLAINHMNVYHCEGWIFNDPNHIALEETFLVKLRELSNKLKGFRYPQSLASYRNNLVRIADELCMYREAEINCMKNNDYNGYVNNNNRWNAVYGSLCDNYNSMSADYNRKY